MLCGPEQPTTIGAFTYREAIQPNTMLEKANRMIPYRIKKEVRRRSKNCCEDCGDNGSLEFHHLRYDDMDAVGPKHCRSIIGRETADDLLHVCRSCHLSRHVVMGQFFREPGDADAEQIYLRDTWGVE